MKILPATVILLVLALGLGFSFSHRREEMAAERDLIRTAWAQVDAELQTRADLLPGLLAAVQDVSGQGRGAFDDMARPRAALKEARTPAERIAANDRLSAALGRLLALVEHYPALKSNANFLRLNDELARAEDRIAAERRNYNRIVQSYNTRIQLFPNTMVASLAGFRREEIYFPPTEAGRQTSAAEFSLPPKAGNPPARLTGK